MDKEAAKCRLARLESGGTDLSVMEQRCSEEPTREAWETMLGEMFSKEEAAAAEAELLQPPKLEPKAPDQLRRIVTPKPNAIKSWFDIFCTCSCNSQGADRGD